MSCLVLAIAMPYPYALPDEPGYHAAPVYDAPIGRVKIQVSHDNNTLETIVIQLSLFPRLTVVPPKVMAMIPLLPGDFMSLSPRTTFMAMEQLQDTTADQFPNCCDRNLE